jgi:phenylpyruvate tautomerase PptA (4-oxalocrotonate tautomerase family)
MPDVNYLMPQVIIHASDAISAENRAELVRSVRAQIPRLLNVPEHIGQVVLYVAPEENRSAHPARDKSFVIAEVTMYPGRTVEMKQAFLEQLTRLIHACTGVDPGDINCMIHEVAPENYCGGVSHSFVKATKEGVSRKN